MSVSIYLYYIFPLSIFGLKAFLSSVGLCETCSGLRFNQLFCFVLCGSEGLISFYRAEQGLHVRSSVSVAARFSYQIWNVSFTILYSTVATVGLFGSKQKIFCKVRNLCLIWDCSHKSVELFSTSCFISRNYHVSSKVNTGRTKAHCLHTLSRVHRRLVEHPLLLKAFKRVS